MICFCKDVFSQTSQIGGIINSYARVIAVETNKVTVPSDAALMFSANDTVLLIQMTGISENGTINSAGRYEFNIVGGVENAGSDVIVTLKSPVSSEYSNSELIQLIRVPSYKNAITTNTLSCQPWDRASGTGGVLALMVDDLFTINHDLDVSGLGFRGGAVDNEPYPDDCNTVLAIHINSNSAGSKGEGAIVASFFNVNRRCWGPAFNGGGGGNGKWSGGGGGANGGLGGNGGVQECRSPGFWGSGNKGSQINYFGTTHSRHVFMGGGGGTGTKGSGPTVVATAGGNGGGIVIIVANRLRFPSNASIKANGSSVAGTAVKAGAGGGGAGGSILIWAKDYDDNNIRAEVMGGKGGDVDVEQACGELKINYGIEASEGAGGGGGGGLLFTSKDENTYRSWYENPDRFKLRNDNNEGLYVNLPGQTAYCIKLIEAETPGGSGVYMGNFMVHLNGFFHNYIFTADTVVCHGDVANIRASSPKIYQSTPAFQWEQSANGIDGWADINDIRAQRIDLSLEFTSTVYLRRVIRVTTDNGTIEDHSTPVKVSVGTPADNEIAIINDGDFCGGETILIGENPPIEGTTYNIMWQINDGIWRNINGATNKNLSMQLPNDNAARMYSFRRIMSLPQGCEFQSNTIDITVYPAITNNILTPDVQEVCENAAEPLTGTAATTGGSTEMFYQWQISFDGSNWVNVEDSNQPNNYQPRPNGQYGERYYRRNVSSDKCESSSNTVTVRFDRQPEPSQIVTADKLDEQALKFKFTTELEASQPSVGSGIWLADDEELVFNSPNEDFITSVSNLKLGSNTVYWAVSNGECSTAPVSVEIFVNDVVVVTGFSPKSIHQNHCFRVIGIDADSEITTCELIILDRYNNTVFESKSSTCSYNLDDCTGWWNGHSSSGREAPAGTYFYRIILNEKYSYNGYVVLK